MTNIRFPLDKTSAGLLNVIIASKDIILSSIRNNTFTLEETQSLADFLIRADHHKDFNIRTSLYCGIC